MNDKIERMAAHTPAKRGLMDRVESEGKKPKEKEQDGEADSGETVHPNLDNLVP